VWKHIIHVLETLVLSMEALFATFWQNRTIFMFDGDVFPHKQSRVEAPQNIH
jgi:hypothetical protein